MPEFIEKKFKSALNKQKYIDSWFWGKYSINPYNGCLFGCIYCDARSAKYHMPEDFENQITIKQDIAGVLSSQIQRSRNFLRDVVVISGVTDPYQGAEKKFLNTRKCLETLATHKVPVHIVTKSDLVLRDLDVLQEIAQNNWCTVSITLTNLDDEKSKFLEKRSPSPKKRLKAVEEIKKKAPQIQTGFLNIPIIPYLSDNPIELEELIEEMCNTGGDYMLFGGGMTLGKCQAEFFLKQLEKEYPNLVEKYEHLYQFQWSGNDYSGNYNALPSYTIGKNELLIELCAKHNLPFRIKRFTPNDYRRENYIIAERLLNRSYINQCQGKEYLNDFWAGQEIQNLDVSILNLYEFGQLDTLTKLRGKALNNVESYLKNLG